MIITTKYRDAPLSEVCCEHIVISDRAAAVVGWNEIRGKDVSFRSETFMKGKCAMCDWWILVSSTTKLMAVSRNMIEIGD